jgi:hypothetical protein
MGQLVGFLEKGEKLMDFRGIVVVLSAGPPKPVLGVKYMDVRKNHRCKCLVERLAD